MTKKIAFQIFLWGTLSSALLFLWLTWDTQRQVVALSHADRLSTEVVAGKRVFEKYNCNDCHTILGFGGYYAPDLTKVVKRLGQEGVIYRVRSPEVAFEDSWRKMPKLGLSDVEIDNLVAFFTWVGEINNGDWPPQDSEKKIGRAALRLTASQGVSPGAAIFQTSGCMNCHSLHGSGGSFGPALDLIGRQYSKEELAHYIRNPKAVNLSAKMPPQTTLSDLELEEVATFLVNLK